jgi:phosphopantothenoylcysteine decarboxylase/phosphopantothenate--cysteine ligase
MGVAVAEAARDRGARVTLVVGTVSVALPEAVDVVRAESAAEMDAVLQRLAAAPGGAAGFDSLVMAAAVADFRPAETATTKIRRSDTGLTLRLVPNPDLLAGIARRVAALSPRPVLVGFAAETGSLHGAAAKLTAKGVDLLVANDVSEPGSGFGTDTNRVTILAADGSEDALPLLPKREVADRILDRVASALDARDARAPSTSPGAGGGGRAVLDGSGTTTHTGGRSRDGRAAGDGPPPGDDPAERPTEEDARS